MGFLDHCYLFQDCFWAALVVLVWAMSIRVVQLGTLLGAYASPVATEVAVYAGHRSQTQQCYAYEGLAHCLVHIR